MLNDFELKQEVISDNKEIFERLHANLKLATQEVLVATSWFTDEMLFEELLTLVRRGVNVDLIIADNAENQKLGFQLLSDAGATVLRIKNVGYGIMHQKFCIIDRTLAIHGTYNWTNNAKNNNHESIIITNHKDTVDSLIKTFFDIKKRAIDILEGRAPEPIENEPLKPVAKSITEPTNGHQKIEKDEGEAFAKVLDAMIAAETSSFDRRALKKEGYERAKATNGDAQVLTTALDSVYSIFVNDINVADEKKKRLVAKVEELKLTTLNSLRDKNNLQLVTLEGECASNETVLKLNISKLQSHIDVEQKEIEGIKQITISNNNKKIDGIKEEISKRERQFIKPAFKLYELIPTSIFFGALLIYLFLFYSSAAYILLFAEADAKQARMNGVTINPPEVFNPEAISLVWDKGASAVVYVLLFVIIPLALSSIKLLTGSKFWQRLMTALALVVVDFFIALKVAFAINEIDYLSGTTDVRIGFIDLFFDPNFYLVFVLGALGLIAYKFTFEKLLQIFNERNPDLNTRQNEVHVKQLRDEITICNQKNTECQETIKNIEKSIINTKTEILNNELSLANLPHKKALGIEKQQFDLKSKTEAVERISEIYKSYIENNDIPIHVDSMKDRINVYLEGWSDLLHEEYSVSRAIDKSRQAFEISSQWQIEKLAKNNIDKRISLY